MIIFNFNAKNKYSWYPKHTKTIIELLKYRSGKYIYFAHNIIELKKQKLFQLFSIINYASRQIYNFDYIVRSTHIVPVTNLNTKMLYFNNYIDWDQFNTLYNKDFLR